MVHSDRYAFSGGENLACGCPNLSPRATVDCWLKSKAGHREYLLSSQVTKAGVGTAHRNGKTFVAWAFSDVSPTYPDCPHYKTKVDRHTGKLQIGGGIVLRTPISIIVGIVGIWTVLLGAHGIYCYASQWPMTLSNVADRLFLVWSIPGRLGDSTFWMSTMAARSWIIPVLVLLAGWMIVKWSNIGNHVSRVLSKYKLW
jgi:hypothetical protein